MANCASCPAAGGGKWIFLAKTTRVMRGIYQEFETSDGIVVFGPSCWETDMVLASAQNERRSGNEGDDGNQGDYF